MAGLLIVGMKAVLDVCDTAGVSTTLEDLAYTVLVRERPSADGTGHTCRVCTNKVQSTKYLDVSAFNNY